MLYFVCGSGQLWAPEAAGTAGTSLLLHVRMCSSLGVGGVPTPRTKWTLHEVRGARGEYLALQAIAVDFLVPLMYWGGL